MPSLLVKDAVLVVLVMGTDAVMVVVAADHTADKYPLPCNEATITMVNEVYTMSISEGHGSGGCGRGCRRGDGPGGRVGCCTKTQGKWGAAKGGPTTPGTNTSSGDGIKKQNGKWMMNCKSCGWNETHTSQFHGEWNCNQATFCIPATHAFWGKSGTTRPDPCAGTASSGISRGQLSGLIN